MSKLLDDIIEQRRQQALDYEAYLAKILDAAKTLGTKSALTAYPASLKSEAERALYDFFDEDEKLALAIDAAVRSGKPADWIGNPLKERRVEFAIAKVLPTDFGDEQLLELMSLLRAQHEYR